MLDALSPWVAGLGLSAAAGFAWAWHRERSRARTARRLLAEQSAASSGLREAAERHRKLFDAIPDFIYFKDADTRHLAINAACADFLGVDQQEALGKTNAELLPAALLEHCQDDDRRVLASGQSIIRREECFEAPDGSSFHLETTKIPLLDERGDAIGLVGLNRDITERKALEAELRQSQKMEALGQLAGGVAHDFNNLLTVILANSELLLMDLEVPGVKLDPARLESSLKQVQSAAQRGAGLTRSLLTFGRPKPTRPARAIDAASALDGLTEMLAPLLPERIELSVRRGEELGHVHAEDGQLEQVLMNLVVNAADAMPEGGRVEVELSRHPEGGEVEFTVRDEGEGMSAEIQARVFEPFFTTKPAGKGTGLGLATVHGIVRRLGGRVDVESRPGRGSTFRVRLPRVDAQAAAPPG